MTEEEILKSNLLKKIRQLNEFIRQMEDLAKNHKVNIEDDKIYILACAQRKFLRDISNKKV